MVAGAPDVVAAYHALPASAGATRYRITMILRAVPVRRRVALCDVAGVCSCVVSGAGFGSGSVPSMSIARLIIVSGLFIVLLVAPSTIHSLSVLSFWLIATSCSPRRCTRAMIPCRAAWSGR